MKLRLKRIHFDPDYTVGELFIDGVRHCFTLEDTVREREGESVSVWKVAGKTAIPVGTYETKISFSNRFQRHLPILLNVPGFVGIRIHTGNSSENTEGCILVGDDWGGGDWIGNSRKAFQPLYAKILEARSRDETVWMEVV